MRSIFWFRRDLRLHDNTGLYHALSGDHPVVPIFIFDTDILEHLEDRDDARVTFIHDRLQKLSGELEKMGSALKVYVGKPAKVFEEIFSSAEAQDGLGKIETVYTNHDYEPSAISRDLQVQRLCMKNGVRFESFKDQVIFEKLEVCKSDGKPYTVYTPYKNKWKEVFAERKRAKKLSLFPSEKLTSNFVKSSSKGLGGAKGKLPTLKQIGFVRSSIEVPDPDFSASLLKNYDKTRNTPGIRGTSRVSVHLRFGTVSVRECVALALKHNDTWLNELIWREFFMQILFNFPGVVESPAKEKYASIKWKNNKKDFARWCEGKTGFALVDAGMRELNATGFMHNRVRMIVGSFLVKNLLIDYRWGEAYLARKLLDFDLSANNGNWQWVAGTGCDAAPYFRVFNPDTQLEKFDPDLVYVRQWIPEYGTDDYPSPMVDLAATRIAAIAAYAEAVKASDD